MAKKSANGEGNILKRTDGTQGVGQAVAPHFDPHCFQHFGNKKAPKTEVFDAFWSCWADSNRRPHPYQGCALPTELQQHIGDQEGARTLDLQRDRLAF